MSAAKSPALRQAKLPGAATAPLRLPQAPALAQRPKRTAPLGAGSSDQLKAPPAPLPQRLPREMPASKVRGKTWLKTQGVKRPKRRERSFQKSHRFHSGHDAIQQRPGIKPDGQR